MITINAQNTFNAMTDFANTFLNSYPINIRRELDNLNQMIESFPQSVVAQEKEGTEILSLLNAIKTSFVAFVKLIHLDLQEKGREVFLPNMVKAGQQVTGLARDIKIKWDTLSKEIQLNNPLKAANLLDFMQKSTCHCSIDKIINSRYKMFSRTDKGITLFPWWAISKTITHVDTGSNCIKKIPPQIANLVFLKELDLRDNQIEEFPLILTQLNHLKKLDMSDNQLTKLPPEICQLTKLTVLDLRANCLRKIPRKVEKLINLKELNVGENKLENLPSEIGKLTKLKRLMVHDNQLTIVPPKLGELIQAEQIDFWMNRISQIPVKLANLPRDCHLVLEGNPLEEVEDFKQLVKAKRSSSQDKQGPWLVLSFGGGIE